MPDESYYKERGEEKNWPKILLIVLGVLVLALIIFLLVKGCNGNKVDGNLENDLLNAGKEYYRIDESLLPQASGECKSVTLGTLVEEELLSADRYSDCNKDKTYVKVCKLESGSYHYLPVMQCGSTLADDNFKPWTEGTESDLVKDKSDVRFTFKGEVLEVAAENLATEEEGWADEIKGTNYKTISSTTYYRYRDLVYKWKTTTRKYYSENAFYTSAPSSEYPEAESVGLGWKWYKENMKSVNSQDRIYAKPFQLTCYNESTNRIVAEMYWVNGERKTCSDYGHTSIIPGYNSDPNRVLVTYTCEDETNISSKPLKSGNSSTICSASCDKGTLSSDKKTCTYSTRSYYPSNATSASGENTYYQNAPVSGLVKDDSTAAQVSKWYKTITNVTDKYYATAPSSGATKASDGVWGNWSSYQTSQPKAYANTRQIESRIKVKYQKITAGAPTDTWKSITDNWVSESELISAFQENGYQVNTLKEIEDASDLRYQVKLEYRNRKK